MPLENRWRTLVNAQVSGAAITAAARTSCIPAAALYTLPPNYFDVIGKQLLLKATGRITSDGASAGTAGTARYDINFLDSAAVNVIVFDGLAALLDATIDRTNVAWVLEILLTCRAIGSAGNLWGVGTWASEDLVGGVAAPSPAKVAMLPWNTAPAVGANFDTTKAQQVDLRFTQTVSGGTPANSMTLDQYSLIAMN